MEQNGHSDKPQKLRINYYVGSMLAQGGDVWLENSKIRFSPTSALDKAMGAKDIEIPFNEIRILEHRGDLQRTINVKTDKKVHKFEGSNARKLTEMLEKSLKTAGLLPKIQIEGDVISGSLLHCAQCTRSLKSDYAFCPFCATEAKANCPSCHRHLESGWVACATCGMKINQVVQPKVSNL